ncbi:hypothetical protein D1AOALGA4SA_9597 [Olavius algarvensis Delta 1 endosymbiont]|nr:hypothetical protein D1AOALGA4SA_9597 [Olavius algarvensis Delta 1 endosymbiont]
MRIFTFMRPLYHQNCILTAEFAESAEKRYLFTCAFAFSSLRALRSRAKRAVKSCLNNNGLISDSC